MTSSAIVQKLWNYCNILRDDGLSYGDYPSAESILSAAEGLRTGSERLTYSVSLKMADERIPLSSPVHCPTGVFRTSCGLSGDWIIDVGEARGGAG